MTKGRYKRNPTLIAFHDIRGLLLLLRLRQLVGDGDGVQGANLLGVVAGASGRVTREGSQALDASDRLVQVAHEVGVKGAVEALGQADAGVEEALARGADGAALLGRVAGEALVVLALLGLGGGALGLRARLLGLGLDLGLEVLALLLLLRLLG